MKFRLVWMMAVALFLVTAPAFAQDDTAADDTAADDTTTDDDTTPTDDTTTDDDDNGGGFTGTLEFSSPDSLQAATTYDFNFRVTNTSDAGDVRNWIYLVEMFMPSADYSLSETLFTPDPLHPGSGEWVASIETDEASGKKSIRWEFQSTVTSAAYGDIEEGDYLDFSFQATTDDLATDGFPWLLVADSGNMAEGTAYIGGADDDSGADDDTTPGDDDDDDDDDGCGC